MGFIALIFMLGTGLAYYFYSSPQISSEEFVVSLSKHIVQVKLLRTEESHYVYQVQRVFKGDEALEGKEIREEKYLINNNVEYPAQDYLYILSFKNQNVAVTFYSKKNLFRHPARYSDAMIELSRDHEQLLNLIREQKSYFYRKPALNTIPGYESFFRRFDQAKEIYLVKALENQQNVEKNTFKSKVVIGKVLVGSKENAGRSIFLSYFVNDKPEQFYIKRFESSSLYSGGTSEDGSTKSPTDDYRCNSIPKLEKD